MLIATNLSNAELLRMNGALPEDRIADLLDSQDQLDAVSGIDAHIKEATGQFPAEDFLSEVIGDLNELVKNVRGANKDAVQKLIEKLDDIAQCTLNATEYARDELQKALKALGE